MIVIVPRFAQCYPAAACMETGESDVLKLAQR